MKKYSSIKKANSPRSFSVKLGYAFVICLGVLVCAVIVPRVVGVVSDVVLAPVHGVATWLRESQSFIPYFVRDRLSLQAEIDELERQLNERAGTESSLARLQEENITLRSLLGEYKDVRLLTRVVARPPFLAYDFLQLDKGERDGVEVGAPVFAGGDVVIGAVVKTGADYSFVELVSSPSFEATVFVTGARVFATMSGIGGGVARVSLAPEVRVEPGDLVLLSAIDGGIFGQITYVVKEPTQPEQFAYIALPESLQSIRFLTIGKKPVAERSLEAAEQSVTELLRKTFVLPDALLYKIASTTTGGHTTSTISTTSPAL